MSTPESLFFDCVERDDVKLVKYLIQSYNIDVHVKGYRGHNLFYFAKSKEMVKLLQSFGLDINEQDDYGRTELHYCHDFSKANMLIECGADPSIIDDMGQLYQECIRRRIIKKRVEENKQDRELAKEDNNANTPKETKTDKELKTPKKQKNKKQKITSYIDEIESKIKEKNITLHDASTMGDSGLIFSLLFNGADVNEKDELGNTPLHYASTELVATILINRGADIYAKNNAGIDVCAIERAFDSEGKVARYIMSIRDKRKDCEMGK